MLALTILLGSSTVASGAKRSAKDMAKIVSKCGWKKKCKSLGWHKVDITNYKIRGKLKKQHMINLARVPAIFRYVLSEYDVQVHLSPSSVPAVPKFKYLKDVKPRNWPAGFTWNDVAGAATTLNGQTHVILGDHHKLKNGARNFALHELAHGWDKAVGFTKNNKAIQKLFKKLRNKPNKFDSNGRYMMSHIEEFFSIICELYIDSPATRADLKRWYPEAYSFAKKSLLKEFTKTMNSNAKAIAYFH
jgi:hypothetical protein